MVVSEQYQTLLTSFSMLRGVDLDTISNVSKHLVAQYVFSHTQLLAFSASLRVAAAATPLDKTDLRQMQSCKAIEHYLTQPDWARLEELGKQPKQFSNHMEDIVAIRMNRLGIVCPDVDTLKRASAIVQTVSGNRATTTDKRSYARGVKQKLKNLDNSIPWAFEYIRNYPPSPFELPGEVLEPCIWCGSPYQHAGLY